MLTRLRILTLFCFALASTHVFADLLLEPYAGYGGGNWKYDTRKENFTGGFLGGRVGFQQLGFQIGGDYMAGKSKDRGNPASDITTSDLGVFAGFEFPILLRVYGVYYFASKNKIKMPGSDEFGYEGTAIKLGVGTTILPLITISVEYYAGKYGELNDVTLDKDMEVKMYSLVASLPLTF